MSKLIESKNNISLSLCYLSINGVLKGELLPLLRKKIDSLEKEVAFCFCFYWVDIDGRITNYGNYRMIFMYS